MSQNVGDRIKQARKAKGLSQTDLAVHMKVSQPTVANWEKGHHAPRHAMLSKVASALDTPQSWLLGEASAAPKPLPAHHHIAVIDWPRCARDLDESPVTAYISATTRAARPLAIINTQSGLAPIGAHIVFDRADQALVDGGLYLTGDISCAELYRYDAQKKPPQPILARAVLIQSEL